MQERNKIYLCDNVMEARNKFMQEMRNDKTLTTRDFYYINDIMRLKGLRPKGNTRFIYARGDLMGLDIEARAYGWEIVL